MHLWQRSMARTPALISGKTPFTFEVIVPLKGHAQLYHPLHIYYCISTYALISNQLIIVNYQRVTMGLCCIIVVFVLLVLFHS